MFENFQCYMGSEHMSTLAECIFEIIRAIYHFSYHLTEKAALQLL